MHRISQGRIVGIGVSRDWLDLCCLPMGFDAECQTFQKVIGAVRDVWIRSITEDKDQHLPTVSEAIVHAH